MKRYSLGINPCTHLEAKCEKENGCDIHNSQRFDDGSRFKK
jgi:hypothetical protein